MLISTTNEYNRHCVFKFCGNSYNLFIHFYVLYSVEALRAAVASHESIETIQELFEGGRVPKDVRAEFWKVREKYLQ